jgi:beta-mannosidase
MAAMTAQKISKGWQFRETETGEWLPVARVPTNVHLDLMDNKM